MLEAGPLGQSEDDKSRSHGTLGYVRELDRSVTEKMEVDFVANQTSIAPSVDSADVKSSLEKPNYMQSVVRQIIGLTRKNLILAYRNRTATFLRIFASCFFILLIFLVNQGLMSRYSADPYFKDYPSPPRKVIDGIPLCVPKYGQTTCLTIVYCPAPDIGGGWVPDKDFANISTFMEATNNVSCSANQCPEMFRVHRIVRAIMATNTVGGRAAPIPASSVLGFMNATAIDTYLSQYDGRGQGAYVFAAAADDSVTFAVQVNTTAELVRGVYTNPYLSVALPMQVHASRVIAQGVNESLQMDVSIQQFAHPGQPVATFEAKVAPIFLIGCAMFPFVIQMAEVIAERELKLRQALSAMGLHDLAYWLSWHFYQSFMALLFGFFVYCFGCIFQLSMFLDNDFGVVFLTFWLFGQAMVGLAFFIGAFLRRAAWAVTVGFGVFLVGFILYFMVSFAGFPYGSALITPFSYEVNSTTGNFTMKSSSDVVWEPFFAFVPPTLLIKSIGDMSTAAGLVVAGTGSGITFNRAYSYCVLTNSCDPNYSVGKCWEWFIGLYVLYSVLGLYLENVLPDAMGVRKSPYYFLRPSYWGFGHVHVSDAVHVVEPSEDEDVLEEESAVQARLDGPMDPGSAIEVRGLRATFKRRGKQFHAVKAPWFCMAKRQLFALLGPNGAGKTTIINMLTGFLPPTAGNALVFNETVAHSSGMAMIRRLMGVCPQFDILWDGLTAREHLLLFGIIKGIRSESVAMEADKRIEEVRLTESANQVAGSYSGGMKRRLSVAVSLVGSPDVVYLDEPTTGMDPINRRHVWDVIEAAKQDRCVVLTTHSMEEADILGDRIGIVAKGRLRCLGNSVRLKSRFGEGYKVSVSCGDNMRPDSPHCVAVKKLFMERLHASVVEESKAYMQFNLPKADERQMAAFFDELEQRRRELGVQDVQLSMSTLEDVFLKVATASELDEAKKTNKTIAVTLKSGEVAGVLLGCEDQLTSERGVTFTVKWGTDENGQLIPVDTVEDSSVLQQVFVRCPAGSGPGQRVAIMYEGQKLIFDVPEGVQEGMDFEVTVPVGRGEGPNVEELTLCCPPGAGAGSTVLVEVDEVQYELEVPDGVQAGGEFTAQIPVARPEGAAMQHVSVVCPDDVSPGVLAAVEVEGILYQFKVPDGAVPGTPLDLSVAVHKGPLRLSREELRGRVERLNTPFVRQANALFRKNLQFQWKRRVTNSCLILIPALVLALIFGIQQAIDSLVLSSATLRCPYCGPNDAFGRAYCLGSSDCPELFFPNSTWDTLLDTYGVDVVAQCKAIAGLGPNGTNDTNYCFGNGNLSCFQSAWASSTQAPYCPITGRNSILTQPPLGFAGLPAVRAKSSILYTSSPASAEFAQQVGNRTVSSYKDLRPKLLGAMRETNRQLFLLLTGIPEFGCSGSALSVAQQQSICRLMQHGSGSDADVCCLDLTGSTSQPSARTANRYIGSWQSGNFTGKLKFGQNYWSDTPSLHNDTAYTAWIAKCAGKKTNLVGQCNLEVITAWLSYEVPEGNYGLRLGSGSGQYLASMELTHALGQFASSQSSPFKALATSQFNKIVAAGESFTCVAPIYASEAAARLPENRCFNLEEGLGILAQASNFSLQLHPITAYEGSPVPDCSSQHTCTFTGINDPLLGTLYADSPGRWPQICDFFTNSLATKMRTFQAACVAEANCSQSQAGFTGGNSSELNTTSRSSGCNTSCPLTAANQNAYLAQVPCLCKWVYYAKPLAAGTFFYTSSRTQTSYQKLPKQFACSSSTDTVQDCSPQPPPAAEYQPAALATSRCWRKTYHAVSVPELRFVSPIWPAANLRSENALSPSNTDWWNVNHILTAQQYAQLQKSGTYITTGQGSGSGSSTSVSTSTPDCNLQGTCWLQAAKGSGNFSFLADNCSLVSQGSCFIQRMANLTGLSVGCISTNPSYVSSLSDINQAMYNGQYRSSNPKLAQEYVNGYDLQDSTPTHLRVTVIYNDTTQLSSKFGAPHFLRLSGPINAAIDAFINVFNLPETRVTAAILGLKEFPRAASFLSVDFGSLLGPFFFTLAFNLLFPTVVVSLVYEKEMKLRVMMRMMGLGTSAYWVINYLFWFLIYAGFTFVFVLVACVVRLPSGYSLGLLTKHQNSIHFVFFLVFILQTLSFALLWSSVVRSSKAAQIGSTLWVLAMSVIAYSAWDTGNFFYTDSIANSLKTFITLWPIWGFYRGWEDYREYAAQAVRMGRSGMTWSDVSGDPLCAMKTVMLVMGVECAVFLAVSLYLDQVLDSGHRVPRHPLFFLSFLWRNDNKVSEQDAEEAAGGALVPADVLHEAQRVRAMFEGPVELHDAVMIDKINKVFPAYIGNPPKVAVRTLTLGIAHGECFGMLGPNGAGKSTTINMLVGFSQPTQGTALVEGFDIRTEMDRIYSLMGVCPQHDVMWETLTARQHMLFYGRLKNLQGPELEGAVREGLKQVNLLHVVDEPAGTFSGGMKRRLSVAISLIGNPLCCYLDEPSTGLDPASRRTLWSCVREAKKSRAVLLTTHSMEEAEVLCDRIGIFVDGALRCVGNPRELTSRFGGFYTVTVTSEQGREQQVADMLHGLARDARLTYSISGTQKFELPQDQATLPQIFKAMIECRERIGIRDWGVANTTLEEAFIRVSRSAPAAGP